MYYNGFSEFEVTQYITKTADEEIAKAPPEMSEDLLVMKYTALGMWMNYPKNLSFFSEIQPELEIKIKLKGMRGVVILLKVDGIVKVDGKMWIRELKTTGLAFSQFEKRCETSPQCTLYTFAVRQHGIPVEGVIYDFVKKPLLRMGVKETKEQFGRRIYLSYKERPDSYYKRHFSYRSQEKLDLFEDDLRNVVKEIRTRCRKQDWYRNPDACWNFNSPCPYMSICFQKNPDPLTLKVFFKQEPINLEKGGSYASKKETSS